tara:strand:+ start:251 stop:487 length:237 start_codon:yes stop_codon:yes gene_type:complete
MKKRKNKPTIKEIQSDMQTLYKVVGSINNNIQTLRVLIEHYLEMKKDTEKLAKFIQKKAEKLEDESIADSNSEEKKDT